MSGCMCDSCPFNWGHPDSEQAQNYGCLPTPYEVRIMRTDHGKSWACHSDESKPCIGAIQSLHEAGLPHKVIDPLLLTLHDPWHLYAHPAPSGQAVR